MHAHRTASMPRCLGGSSQRAWRACALPSTAPPQLLATRRCSSSMSKSRGGREGSRGITARRCLQREGSGVEQQQAPKSPTPAEHTAPATSQSPAASASSSSSGDQQPAPDSSSSSSSNGTQPTLLSEVDRRLLGVWEDVKRDMRRDVDPELAQVLDTMSYEELTSSDPKRFFKNLADKLLGDTMVAMGLDMDPLEFLLDMIKLATFLQFVACGLVWYGSQGLGHADTGDAIKATVGLAIGCLTRPAFKVEHLLYPLYNSILQLFVPNGAFILPSSSRDEVQSTANRLGVTLALAFLLPQLLWGWDSRETAVLVGPLCAGWIVFDLSYMSAMMLIISRSGEDDGSPP